MIKLMKKRMKNEKELENYYYKKFEKIYQSNKLIT